ncbi:hypothetical protein PRNP1_010829 [Phytophthora ramorum]
MFSRSRSRQLLRSMFIQTESTLNPLSVKFFPGHAELDDRFTTGVGTSILPENDEVMNCWSSTSDPQ